MEIEMGTKTIKVLDSISEKHNPSGWVNYKSSVEWELIDAILEDLREEPEPKGQILFESHPGVTRSINPLSDEDIKRNISTILYSNLEYAQSMKLLNLRVINPESDLELLVRILEEVSKFPSDQQKEFLLKSLQVGFQNLEFCIQNIVIAELAPSYESRIDLIRKLLGRTSQVEVEKAAEKYFTPEKSNEVIEDARQKYKLKLLEKQAVRNPIRRTGVQYTLTQKGSAYVEYGRFRRWVMRKTSFLNPTWVILGVIVSAKPFVESLMWLYFIALGFFEILRSLITSS